MPDIQKVVSEKAGWLFFTTWSGSILFEKTTPAQLRADYNNPYVLNLGDLPDLKNYPVEPAGNAVKLGFYGAPENTAINGGWRMPLEISVQDRHGKTVRTGNYSVTLALKENSAAKISGGLTASTVNGIATFSGAQIDSPLADCKLLATAKDLRAATSPAFAAGPGNGLLYEWWTNETDFAAPPDGQKILGAALESPVNFATNFSARVSGEMIAPVSGTYKFWLAGAGDFELWLSTDTSPTNKVKMNFIGPPVYHKWPHTTEAETQTVVLAAGKKYNFEMRQQQTNGSTQFFVRWQLPDGREERPIPAFQFLHPIIHD